MYSTGWPIWIHLASISIMATVVVMNHRVMRRVVERRTARDSVRLRVALCAELAAIQALYSENLRRLSERAAFVLSGKGLQSVYRANIGRLVLLTGPEIEVLVTAAAAQERVEGLLAGHGKPRTNLAWELPPNDAKRAEIRCAILHAAAAAERARAQLSGQTDETGVPAGEIRPVGPAGDAALGELATTAAA